MALRLAAGLGGTLAGITLVERLPVAFHEAGHAVVALHLLEAGVVADGGCKHGRLVDAAPMLRFCTVTPRQTSKGQTYMGETKLTVRWRDMHEHVHWQAASSSSSSSNNAPSLAGTNDAPAALLGLARIAYLFGGRVGEERLKSAIFPRIFTSADGDAKESVRRLMESPGNAGGDLRKAEQVALKTQKLPSASSSDSRERVMPPFVAAYTFADAILRQRWHDVCALSGALLVRGTVDGEQAAALSAALIEAQRAKDAGCPVGTLSASFPFVFGCAFAAGVAPQGELPPRSPRLEGPAASVPSKGGAGFAPGTQY